MNNDLVSVIVPVYNVESYIEKCTLSLIKQTYSNIEIILVDDGSPDRSPAIVDALAKMDSRIHVVHQKNQGESVARNKGLEVASGKYIMFVDGDDWVEDNYVEYFLSLIKNENALMAVDINNYSGDSVKTSDAYYAEPAEKVIEWIYSEKISVAVWNKIFTREVLIDNSISFNPQIWYGEGMLFNIQYLQYVDEVVVGEKSVYHQRYNTDSATRKFNPESNLCGIRSLDIQKTQWKKKSPEIEREWEFHKYRFNKSIVCGLLRSDLASEYSELYKTSLSQLRKGILMPLRMEKSIKAKLGWIMYFFCPELMAKRSINIQKSIMNKISGGGLTKYSCFVTCKPPVCAYAIGGYV